MLGLGFGLNRGRRVGGFVGLLDRYPNAAAAYSLRKLRAAYSSSAVRVRKEVSTVSSETDIGFLTDGSLDTVSLLAFASDADSGDVFVVTWYDQSLSNDATQGTAASQPKIVSGGSLVTENGKPAVDFDGVDDYLSFSTISSNTLTVIDVGAMEQVYLGGTLRYFAHFSSFRLRIPPINYDYDTRPIGQKMSFFYANGVSSGQAYNGGSLVVNALTDNINLSDISKYSTNIYENNGFQELIIYPSDQSSNRTGIETNINTFYSIYP